jgi:hypothetical protein
MSLVPGQVNVVNLRNLNLTSASFSIQAIAQGSFSKVVFDNGQLESLADYARCGNNGPDYGPCGDLQTGATKTVWAQAIDGSGKSVGSQVSVTIQIVAGPPMPAPTNAPVPTPVSPPVTRAPLAPTAQHCGIPQVRFSVVHYVSTGYVGADSLL